MSSKEDFYQRFLTALTGDEGDSEDSEDSSDEDGEWAIDDKMVEVTEGLYIGSEDAASNQAEFEKNKITHVLICAHELDPIFPDKLQYKKIKIMDVDEAPIIMHFEDCYKFIESSLDANEDKKEKGACLVHCVAGVSRSASVVLSYLMKKKGLSRSEAIDILTKIRPVISPNEGFMEQLDLYEKMGCNTVGESPYHDVYKKNFKKDNMKRKRTDEDTKESLEKTLDT